MQISGMEAKYNCCKAIHWFFTSSSKLASDPALTGIAEKVRLDPSIYKFPCKPNLSSSKTQLWMHPDKRYSIYVLLDQIDATFHQNA